MRSALLVFLGLVGAGSHRAAFLLSSDPLSSYEVVHGWPVLAEDYILGQASGVGVDSHNRVFERRVQKFVPTVQKH